MSDSVAALSIRVIGRVQGVGFRYFTVREARRFFINGWVRNEWDGSVLIHAEAQGPALETFKKAVERGPSMSRVDKLIEMKAEVSGFTDFSVEY